MFFAMRLFEKVELIKLMFRDFLPIEFHAVKEWKVHFILSLVLLAIGESRAGILNLISQALVAESIL